MNRGFDSEKYFKLQTDAIRERVTKFPGKLYFEIGGKFLFDGHAERVLPGFDPKVKIEIIKSVSENLDIIFCINSEEINNVRILKNGQKYLDVNLKLLQKLKEEGFSTPKIALNIYNPQEETKKLEEQLQSSGYKVFHRYKIEGYPDNLDRIVSSHGFGKDDYIETDANFVLVIAAEPNSGKMSTCLGQVYLDSLKGIDSGYAKYETFPVWNLPLEHPINYAYEAATADIGDYNTYDPFHQEAYGLKAVNYNRDVDAFPIIKKLIDKIVSPNNFMATYKSPTDMGISKAGFCINDDKIVSQAALEEIKRRKEEYVKMLEDGDGKQEWIDKCNKLIDKINIT